MTTPLERLSSGYYNSGEVGPANPGGLGGGGHEINFPAMVSDFAAVAASVASAVDAINGAADAATTAQAAAAEASAARDDAVAAAATFTAATKADIWGGTDDTKFVTAKALREAAAPQVLAYGGVVNLDFASGVHAKVTLTGDATLAQPTHFFVGWTHKLDVIQGGAGGFELAFNACYNLGRFGAPSWSTAAGKRDRLVIDCYDDTPGAPKFSVTFIGDA